MESKHTKGTWKVDPYNEISIIDNYTDGFNKLIAQVNGKSGEEKKANAKLIAASPELLEALKDLVWLIEEGATSDEINEAIRLKSKPAIEKATK